MAERWGGWQSTQARAMWRSRLPLPCYRCGRPVHDGQKWHVEHVVPRALGGPHGVENQWVSHQRCNLAHGGALKAQIAAANRPATSSQRIEPHPLEW